MSFDTLQESRILRKILRIVGLWVDDGEHRVPSIVVGLLIHGPLTFSYTILMWIDVFVSSDLTQATDVLYIALTETALVVKIISILTHRKLARSIFDAWQTDDRFKLQSLEERLMWKESFATFTIVSIPYIACSISVVGCTFAAALIKERLQVALLILDTIRLSRSEILLVRLLLWGDSHAFNMHSELYSGHVAVLYDATSGR